ncbi:HAD family hydrolase [Rubellimicrobium roseum]|uniref:HAD family phosphatase n=1 Tax=Rubellimicrobium roseum TaxID=687525 RepID=A0A5C4N6S7_9RHOB|nr:HAD family phosphatase [Rubellimicrobium roseum]TNC62463.1 HAD family phosphatase [Rubellimicrobium roseum]
MTPQAVVFDIGNVLIEWKPERFYDRVVGEPRRRQFFDAVAIHAMNERVDLGAVWEDEVEALAQEHPDWAPEIRHWRHRWIEMASPEIPRSVRLLRALRARGVPVFALSNFGRETFDEALRHYPFLAEFDRAFVSGHLRLAKPDPAIYETVERDSGLAPSALLFTDDRPENVEAAAARGWRTHLFRHPDPFAELLVAEGLLSPEEAQ